MLAGGSFQVFLLSTMELGLALLITAPVTALPVAVRLRGTEPSNSSRANHLLDIQDYRRTILTKKSVAVKSLSIFFEFRTSDKASPVRFIDFSVP